MTGIELFLDVLAAAGVTRLFGNPGTTELPLNDALVRDPRFVYCFGVQEIPLVAMADGYTMASGCTGVVNVHVTCGLGHAMGMLYNAHIEGTPLLLTAGQQDRRLRLGEPVIEGDTVRMAAPWTKWSYEISRVEDIPTAVRRALQIAHTPPTGPVFLSLPIDVQMEEVRFQPDRSPPHWIDRRVRPPAGALEHAADLLAAAKAPVILAGSRVAEADAALELANLADRLGAPVYSESTPSHGRLPLAPSHPLYRGPLPLWSPQIRQVLDGFDVALAVGLNVLRLYIYCEPEEPLPPGLRLIHLDNSPREIGKNYPPACGLWGDLRCGLAELNERLAARGCPTAAAEHRRRESAAARRVEQRQLHETAAAQASDRPLAPLVLMHALSRVLPPRIAVVEEAITTHQNVFERLGAIHDPRAFFAHRGWALGWGLGCALGVKLAWPDRPVLGLIGDGAALYGIQALWSAAHHRLPVTFVIANNAQYKILRVCGDVLQLPQLRDARCPGLDITEPLVDYVGLARAFGVEAHRVTDPDELSDRVQASWTRGEPLLLDVPIQA
uniref:Thiamine pyrophosphate-binding protein n=1 Tax=Schlesneria paludicola TaxID=360056 RepID=A0A7C4LK39_9PLAN